MWDNWWENTPVSDIPEQSDLAPNPLFAPEGPSLQSSVEHAAMRRGHHGINVANEPEPHLYRGGKIRTSRHDMELTPKERIHLIAAVRERVHHAFQVGDRKELQALLGVGTCRALHVRQEDLLSIDPDQAKWSLEMGPQLHATRLFEFEPPEKDEALPNLSTFTELSPFLTQLRAFPSPEAAKYAFAIDPKQEAVDQIDSILSDIADPFIHTNTGNRGRAVQLADQKRYAASYKEVDWGKALRKVRRMRRN